MKKLTLALVASGFVTTAVLAAPLTAVATTAPALKNQTDKVSYTIGYDLGKNFKTQQIDVNQTTLVQGLTAGLSGAKPAMTEAQMHTTMADFQKQMMKKALAKQEKLAKTNLEASQSYLAKVAKEKGVKELAPGLYYKVVTAGHGPMPMKTDTVVVNYKGTLSNGKVFDSSYKRGKPATFRVDQVIPGWTKALQHMPQGSTWMLYIAPKLAYGKFAPPTIGPNQALTFKVDLIKVEKPKAPKDSHSAKK